MADTTTSSQSSPPAFSGSPEQTQALSFRMGVFGAARLLIFCPAHPLLKE